METTISYFDAFSEKEFEEYINGQKEVDLYFDNEEADLEDDWKFNESEYMIDYYADYHEPLFYIV